MPESRRTLLMGRENLPFISAKYSTELQLADERRGLRGDSAHCERFDNRVPERARETHGSGINCP